MDETAAGRLSAIVEGLLECIEDEACMGSAVCPPTDDPPCERIGDEREIHALSPSRDILKSKTQSIRRGRAELPVDEITRARRRAAADRRGDRLVKDDTRQAHCPQEPCDRAARDVEPFALHLPQDLAYGQRCSHPTAVV